MNNFMKNLGTAAGIAGGIIGGAGLALIGVGIANDAYHGAKQVANDLIDGRAETKKALQELAELKARMNMQSTPVASQETPRSVAA